MDENRFAGAYAFWHDGWPGLLTLRPGAESKLDAQYDCLRSRGQRYGGSLRISDQDPRRFRLVLYRFNQLQRQVFEGYQFGPSGGFLAGITQWRGTPYGFFARRGVARYLTPFTVPGEQATRSDLMGHYNVWQDRGAGTLEVVPRGRALKGIYTDFEGNTGDATIALGGEYGHQVTLRLRLEGEPASVEGYLFTRPKNGVAGIISRGGRASGFFMAKVRMGET